MLGNKDKYANWHWEIDAELSKTNKYNFKHDYTSTYDYAQATYQQEQKISSDLSKKFFSNGSELEFKVSRSLPTKDEQLYDNNGYQKDKNTTEYLDDLSVSWTIPLLKNKNGIADQKSYDLSVLEYDDEKLVLAEVQEDFVKDKVDEFIDWVGYTWQIDTVKQTINRLTNLATQIQAQQAKDKDKNINKNNDRTLRKNKGIGKDNNSRNKKILKNSINKHKRLLLSLQSKLKAQNILLLSAVRHLDLDKNTPKLTHKFSINLIDNLEKYCKTVVRDIKRINIEILKNNRYIKTYKNANLADLDFTISASQDNNKGNYSTYSKSSATEYEAKLEFTYMLSGDVSNQVSLDKYQLKSRQLELKFNNKLDEIVASAKKIATNIKQGQIQLGLIKEQLQVLESGYELDLGLETEKELGLELEAKEKAELGLGLGLELGLKSKSDLELKSNLDLKLKKEKELNLEAKTKAELDLNLEAKTKAELGLNLEIYLKNQDEMIFVINEANDYQDLQLEEIDILIDLYKDKLKYDSLLDRLLTGG
jgi:hypothetical protein